MVPERIRNQNNQLTTLDVVNYFEEDPKYRWPNLLIFEIESEGTKQVVVGFNSCGWTTEDRGN